MRLGHARKTHSPIDCSVGSFDRWFHPPTQEFIAAVDGVRAVVQANGFAWAHFAPHLLANNRYVGLTNIIS